MPIQIRCKICRKSKLIKPCHKGILKTCGSRECKSKYRAILSRKQLLKNGSPSQNPKVAEKIRQKTLRAYQTGKMQHMDFVWKKSAKRWKNNGNPRWKPLGSKRKTHDYTFIKTKNGWLKEERLVAEKCLGRKLRKYEIIHHINGKKSDNRPKNLFVMTQKQHKAWHTLDNLRKMRDNDCRPKLKSNLILQ